MGFVRPAERPPGCAKLPALALRPHIPFAPSVRTEPVEVRAPRPPSVRAEPSPPFAVSLSNRAHPVGLPLPAR